MTIKRTLSIIIVLLLILSLCACGSSNSSIIVSSNPDTSGSTAATAASTAFTTAPSTVPTSAPATVPATIPATEVTTAPVTQPPHVHSFSSATCTSPKTCSCGATESEANGHKWKDATCSEPQTCTVCGATSGTTADHSFSDGKCSNCGENDPNFSKETMVWIPTKGGKKYHTNEGCSNMIDPDHVTLSQAEALGFTPCKRCH